MEVGILQYPPGDSRMIDKIVHQLKSQGIFDQFRKECIADVDTKPAYQNLHQRVEGTVSGFLASQVWRPDLNKNQLRDSLRKHIHESGFLDIGVERIVDQVVNPKIPTVFMPQVEDVVYGFLGIEKPKKGKENQTVYVAPLTAENLARKEERKLPTLTDLLPKELEPISPESDTLKEKEDNSVEDGEVGFPGDKEEEDSSPPFEPIEVNSQLEDSSMDSHLSGISELTSHESQHSNVSLVASNNANNCTPTKLTFDLSNNDSQLSKVSSGSRLSIVSLGEQDSKMTHNVEVHDESQQSKTSLQLSGPDTQMSVSVELQRQENEMVKDENSHFVKGTSTEELFYKLQTCVQDNSQTLLDSLVNEKTKDLENNTQEEAMNERLEKTVDNGFEEICDKPEVKLNDVYETGVFENRVVETEGKKLSDKCENKPDDGCDKKTDEKSEKRMDRFEIKIEEKFDKSTNKKSDKKIDELFEVKLEEMSDNKVFEKFERTIDEENERKPEEKVELKFDEKFEKKIDKRSERRLEEKYERKTDDKFEKKTDDKCDEKLGKRLDDKHEKKTDERLERRSCEQSEKKFVEKFEKKLDEKLEKKSDQKYERKLEDKIDRKIEDRSEKKLEDRSEKKLDEVTERKLSEKFEKKSDEKYDKKSDEKIIKKSDDRSTRKSDEKSEKKSIEKTERKWDEKFEKKIDEKSDKKSDVKSDKKLDDKHDKKQDKHREDREKVKEKKDDKKRLSNEIKDIKRSDSISHSSESDRKRSDKDKHKKERSDSRNRTEKSSKHDGKEKMEKNGVKDKLKHEERNEKDSVKEKAKQEIKEGKDDKKNEEKERKVEKDTHKEKSKREDSETSKHEKEVKKYKNDEKKDRDGKEKSKSEDKGQLKHDDKHKDKIKYESRDKSDKEKSSRHDEKNNKDGNRPSSKEFKDRMKQDSKDKGKDTTNRSDEKKTKEKLKHDENSSKLAEKGAVKKPSRRKDETDSTKSSHTDHKSKGSEKKGKENKRKSTSDDHRLHRDKRSDDRRSTDRDSNGTAQDRSLGSTTSRTNGNDSQRSQSRRDKTSGSSSNSSKSDGGNSESSGANTQTFDSSKNVDDQVPSTSKSTSPPSSLPFKKRPLSIQSEDEQSNDEYQPTHTEPGKTPLSKIKKPKIAANIFEVKKIMMLRKSLAKKERKQQKELKRCKGTREGVKDVRSGKKLTKPVTAKRKKLGDIENSLRKEVHISLSNKQIPEVESDKEDTPELRYFDSEMTPSAVSYANSEFLAYVKRLAESDNLSEISTSSDTGSEVSDVDDIIHLSNIDLDNIVAAELGAKIINTENGTEILLDLPKGNSLAVQNFTAFESLPVKNKVSRAVESHCDAGLRFGVMESRPNSVLSNWSDRSADDIVSYDIVAKRTFRQRSSSAASTNSNKSISDKMDTTSNGIGSTRIRDVDSKLRKKVFSRKRLKREPSSMSEMKPPEALLEKRELRRSRKPNTRYSSTMFASYTDGAHLLVDEDMSCEAFSEERENVLLDDESARIRNSVVNNVSKSRNVADRHDSRFRVSSGTNKITFTRIKVPATVTQAEDDGSDREIMTEPSAGDGYDVIKDNNNVDKGSSEDERGCGDGSMLNQDLILPTLRDLMVESGFRREDDKSDILPPMTDIENPMGNSLQVTRSNVNSEIKQKVRDTYRTGEKAGRRRTKLGRSRRVGLGKPPPRKSAEQGGDDISGNKTVPSLSSNVADFVMPLSPESDVSASSGEAKKAVVDSKVAEGRTDPSPSNSEEKGCQLSNNRLGDADIRRSLRSGGLGTPAVRGQRYSSDDLYKPRPLFSQGSRRVRGRVSPSFCQESAENCTSKRRASDVAETLQQSVKRRR